MAPQADEKMTVITRVTDTVLDIKDDNFKSKFKIMIRVILVDTKDDGTPMMDIVSTSDWSTFGSRCKTGMMSRRMDYEMRIVFNGQSYNDGTVIDEGDLEAISRFIERVDETLNRQIPGTEYKRAMNVGEFVSIYNTLSATDKIKMGNLFGLKFSEDHRIMGVHGDLDMCLGVEYSIDSDGKIDRPGFIKGPILEFSSFAYLLSRISVDDYTKKINPYQPSVGMISRNLITITLAPHFDGSIQSVNMARNYFPSLTDSGVSFNTYEYRMLHAFCSRFEPVSYVSNIKNTFIYSHKTIPYMYAIKHPFESAYATSQERRVKRYQEKRERTMSPEEIEASLVEPPKKTTPPNNNINNIFNALK